MRAVSPLLLVTGLLTLDLVLYVGLPRPIGGPSPLNSPVLLLVVLCCVIVGFAYGLFLARRVTRSLERTGFLRATRRRVLASLAVAVPAVSLYVWFIGLIFTIISPFLIAEFSLLASMFAAQSIAYLRWERRTGNWIEYEGVWGFRAVSRSPSILQASQGPADDSPRGLS